MGILFTCVIVVFFLMLFGCGVSMIAVPNMPVVPVVPTLPIVCSIYDLSAFTNVSNMLDYDTLNPIGKVEVNQIDNANTDSNTPFQMFENTPFAKYITLFGLQCMSKLLVPITGNYQFQLTSDDGAILYIDGVTIVNNDGLHAELTIANNFNINAGIYPIKVVYFNNQGYKAFVLSWTMPGDVETIIEPQYFIQ